MACSSLICPVGTFVILSDSPANAEQMMPALTTRTSARIPRSNENYAELFGIWETESVDSYHHGGVYLNPRERGMMLQKIFSRFSHYTRLEFVSQPNIRSHNETLPVVAGRESILWVKRLARLPRICPGRARKITTGPADCAKVFRLESWDEPLGAEDRSVRLKLKQR